MPGSAISSFVNANALLSYIPLTYLTEPFTITGHCYALRRAIFDAVGGLEDMAGRESTTTTSWPAGYSAPACATSRHR